MEGSEIEVFTGSEITEEIVASAAKFFNENYGIWGPLAAEKMGNRVTYSSRIKISTSNLRQKILSPNSNHIYIRLVLPSPDTTHKPLLIGNLFATYYLTTSSPPKEVLWITQLVVHAQYRNKGVAKKMLQHLLACHKNTTQRQDDSQRSELCVGILSSHPFAIRAVLSIFTTSKSPDLNFMQQNATDIMTNCPVSYVKHAKVGGSIFNDYKKEDDGVVCVADTEFWVDHWEPDDALRVLREKGIDWELGVLPEGCEFLCIVRMEEKQ